MADITIPAGFAPLVQGYSFGAPGGIVRTELAGGMSRYTQEWEGGPQEFQVSMRMPTDQFAVWSAFYHHVILKGALPFAMPLDSGLGVETHTVRLTSYAAQWPSKQQPVVSFTVATQATVYGMTLDAAQAIIDAYNGYPAAPGLPAIPRGIRPVVQGYGFDGPGGVMVSQTPGPAARNALATDRDSQMFHIALVLEPAEFTAWTAFFLRVLRGGALAFSMPIDSGMGVQDHYCQVIPGSYSASRASGQVMAVSFAVEAVSRVYDMERGDAQAWLDLWNTYGAGYNELLARLDQFANVDMLVLQP